MIIKSISEVSEKGINAFSCGNHSLDYFFQKYARKNDQIGYGKTFVAVEGKEIVGFFTLSSAQIEFESFPKKLGPEIPKYPIPCIRIARLAVSKDKQGQGYGKELLKQAFLKIVYASLNIGIRIVLVDAKESSKSFYEHFGFQPLKEDGSTYYMNMSTVIDAFISSVNG